MSRESSTYLLLTSISFLLGYILLTNVFDWVCFVECRGWCCSPRTLHTSGLSVFGKCDCICAECCSVCPLHNVWPEPVVKVGWSVRT